MNSLYKYISLLAIAILAISTFGSASAAENHTNGTQTVDLFYRASADPVFISPDNIVNIEALFDQFGLSRDDYFKIIDKYGQKFINFDKQVVPLVGVVPHFDNYDVSTDTAYFTDNTVRLFVLP
ncbi:MAG: hypothetical protein LBR15_08305 [Methanobrevibacter sp.]|jgi:hypothetical protein|nr:hypothetical protein [Candidatus Methanovirga australis]